MVPPDSLVPRLLSILLSSSSCSSSSTSFVHSCAADSLQSLYGLTEWAIDALLFFLKNLQAFAYGVRGEPNVLAELPPGLPAALIPEAFFALYTPWMPSLRPGVRNLDRASRLDPALSARSAGGVPV